MSPATIDMQCKYSYKECTNLRTYKRDGDLHRLCEYHRNKANALQKVYATKRRQEMRALKRAEMEKKMSQAREPVAKPEIKVEYDLACLLDDDFEPLEVYTDVDGLSDEEYAYLSTFF
ncbi:Aste57867_10798 [Aphanomyces stellatus]|uniref:Aste57867_10798 protein n=1 Tax=Aphanomyces stellatus TaxID=120398 RepID=A0A485KEZ4_9STRA|nr:hypothetical protein As57867_010758 [Aphanomyces stellatus]KAF0706067.1 hypothetical protein As57867_006813 [Aphanomyces stellatus]KAF0709669.1 hypothetical protein As57867_005782 [Aphanomyces stellatus]VFT82819.1 Aste57867_5796 [Aphanomyces stellatus]VFT83797.1 Aste57867_6834 [Aphanomyces stellatus]